MANKLKICFMVKEMNEIDLRYFGSKYKKK